jgi:DNA modification methylase
MSVQILQGDCREVLRALPAESVQCVVTSPPYFGLRDYQTAVWRDGDPGCTHEAARVKTRFDYDLSEKQASNNGSDVKRYGQSCPCGATRIDNQIGLEQTPAAYVEALVEVFREVWRVLRKDGTLWLNLGDSYAGSWGNYGGQNRGNGTQRQITNGSQAPSKAYEGLENWKPPTATVPGLKPKDLIGIPWRVAFALQAEGWYLRSAITWCKTAAMPESVRDRPSSATEMIFLFAKDEHYYYDQDAVRTATGANLRNYWLVGPQPFGGAVVYGKRRITSPDCPIHGYQADQAHVPECDALRAASHSDHNPYNDVRHAQSPVAAASSSTGDRSASLFGSVVAIPHNKGTRRKADESMQGATFFDISEYRTEYTVPAVHSASNGDHTHENNTAADSVVDAQDSYLSAQTADHNDDTVTFDPPPDDCTCKYTGKVEKRQDHFAVFPEKLIEPCILAGTSPRACEHCGAGWKRITEREGIEATRGTQPAKQVRGVNTNHDRDLPGGYTPTIRTLGWQPTCLCEGNTGSGRSIVLDPFAGSGTVLRVATRHGRDGIGIELNEDYIAIAERRLNGVQLALDV